MVGNFTLKRNKLINYLDNASNGIKGTLLDQSKSFELIDLKENECREATLLRNDCINYMRTQQKPSITSIKECKESTFNISELPIKKCLKTHKLPDYQLNPHKWKKYSLSDVDISEKTNMVAAFAFLREMDKQKARSHDVDGLNHSPNKEKIEFKKISKAQQNPEVAQKLDKCRTQFEMPRLKGSKLIMPEYVVGSKSLSNSKKKLKRCLLTKEKKEESKGEIHLAHLQTDIDIY